jgi:hypothetical protein
MLRNRIKKMAKKTWVYAPKKAKVSVAKDVKERVKTRADKFIDTVLKPKHIKPPSKNSTLNYIVDIYSKWYRHYFYFCAKYNCTGENAIAPSFETKFARLEYLPGESYILAYMRHTNQWFELIHDISLENAFREIKDGPHFIP